MNRLVAAIAALAVLVYPGIAAQSDMLSGTSWRLLKIMSMDDRVDTPDDPSRYTLTFQADGRAAILADCNRGTGSWISESGSQLQFGPIAATRAMCPPGSISDKYLAQFEWVRSYVIENDHLFLATMADGSIVEFEPAGKVTAMVYGDEIHSSDTGEVQETILTRLFDRYAAEKGIKADKVEVEAYLELMRIGMAAEGLTEEKDLTPEEADQVTAMRQSMAQSLIRQWKINKALYNEFGGRIIYQQLGPEPLDAYRRFLEQRQSEGAFAFSDPSLEKGFWRYFTDETIHDFMKPGSVEEAGAFSVAPWNKKQ